MCHVRFYLSDSDYRVGIYFEYGPFSNRACAVTWAQSNMCNYKLYEVVED